MMFCSIVLVPLSMYPVHLGTQFPWLGYIPHINTHTHTEHKERERAQKQILCPRMCIQQTRGVIVIAPSSPQMWYPACIKYLCIPVWMYLSFCRVLCHCHQGPFVPCNFYSTFTSLTITHSVNKKEIKTKRGTRMCEKQIKNQQNRQRRDSCKLYLS